MSQIPVDNRQTHGHATLKRAVKTLGSRTIDKRTSVGKALSQWRGELIDDLGGDSAVSTQQRAVIDLCCTNKLMGHALDVWLLKQPSLVNARKKSVLPVLLQRTQLADALVKYLGQLGMLKKAKPRKTLMELLSETSPNPSQTEHNQPRP